MSERLMRHRAQLSRRAPLPAPPAVEPPLRSVRKLVAWKSEAAAVTAAQWQGLCYGFVAPLFYVGTHAQLARMGATHIQEG